MKYIAMNRFKIVLGKENEFEEVWRTRETYLDEVEGFKEFHLLKGESNDEYTLYSSHSVWDSKDDFIAWTKSESFKNCLLYTSPSPRDAHESRMPSSA